VISTSEVFSRIAVARSTGTEANRAVRADLAEALKERGFTVQEQEFPAGPDSLDAVQRAGVLLAIGALVALALPRIPALADLTAIFTLLLVAGLGAYLAYAANRDPRKVATGVNLIGRKGSGLPAAWLMAHYDSKSQRLSMAGRIVALGFAAIGAAGLLAFSATPTPMASLLALPAIAGGALLARCRTGNESSGALDNATAVVAVLEILDQAPGARLGVVFTDAEEWGLLGARFLAKSRPDLFGGRPVINLDGLDDRGQTILLAHRPGPLTSRLRDKLKARVRRRLPVLVDGMAMAPVAGLRPDRPYAAGRSGPPHAHRGPVGRDRRGLGAVRHRSLTRPAGPDTFLQRMHQLPRAVGAFLLPSEGP